VATGSIINLPAVLVVAAVTIVLVVGIRESASFNAVMVAIKVSAVLFVILVGMFFINPENWRPFAPFGYTGMSFFGKPMFGEVDAGGQPLGMLAGAAIAFFAYIGFDAVSTQAEEAKRPHRDVPIGILASLGICTVLYIAVVAVLTGMVSYDQIAIGDPVADAFGQVGLPWAKLLIAAAGVAGITSVLLVMMLSQPRVLLAMSRDGLLPRKFFAAVHDKFRTPWKSTILTGLFVGSLAAFLPITVLLHLVNMGTLMAFAIVCGAVLVMRRTHPDAERPFRVPFVPLLPILGILSCLMLMLSLPPDNWLRLIVWLAIGLVIYFFYGRHHSIMATRLKHEITQHGVSGAGAAVDE
jgi:APA family basic amino acid/polyamine antiporter